MSIEINSQMLSGGNTNKINSKIARDIKEAIKTLPDGQVKGKVLEVKNGIAQILTEQGQHINGKLQYANQLNIGDVRQFLVSTDEKGITYFSIVPEDMEMLAEGNIKSALLELGIDNSEKNIEIAKELIKNNLPINKEQFQQVNKGTLLMGDKSEVSHTIFLVKNNIPITQSNVNILSDFTTNNFKISTELNNIQQQINNLPDGPLKDSLLNILNNEGKSNITMENSNVNQSVENNPINNNITSQTNNPTPNANISINTNINANTDASSNINGNTILNENKESINLNQSSNNIGNNQENSEKVQNTNNDFLKELMENLGNQKEKNIISDSKKTENQSQSKWSLKLDISNSKLEDLDKHIKDTNGKIEEMIKETLKYDSPESKAILENLTNTKDRLLFANNLKENFYVQIPINIDKNQTVELLVYKDKKKSKNKNGSSSAIIGLDTENLGRFETFIEKEQNNINLQFKLENKDIIKLVKENIHQLDSLLKEKGLSINSLQYSEIKENFNITTEDESSSDTLNNFKLNIKM